MGRKSVVAEIESRFERPLADTMAELDSKGDYKYIAGKLGVQKSTVYKLLDLAGLGKKHRPPGPQLPLAEPKQVSELDFIIANFIMAKEIENKTAKTIRFYKTNLVRFAWFLSNIQKVPLALGALEVNTIRAFLYYIKTEKVRFGGHSTASRHSVSKSTSDAYWRTLQAFCSWLVKEKYFKDETFNPMRKIERPRQSKVIIPDISREDLNKILGSFDTDYMGTRDRAIVLVLLDTGSRLSECAGMTIKGLNLEAGTIKVIGKGDKERLVKISVPTIESLKKYLHFRGTNNCPGLWLTDKKKGLTTGGLDAMIKRLNRLNLDEHINPHKFRHTFAIHFLRAGGDPFTLQMLGGWEDLEMPRRYADALKQEDALKKHESASPVKFLLGGDDAD